MKTINIFKGVPMKKLLFAVATIALVAQSVFAQGKTDVARHGMMNLIYKNIGIDSIGDATGIPGSSAADSLYVILLKSSPTNAGTLSDTCTFTGYKRVGVLRGAGWEVSNDSAWNAGTVTFPQCTGGTETATHAAIVWQNKVYDWIQLSTPLSISNGVTVRFQTKTLIFTAKNAS